MAQDVDIWIERIDAATTPEAAFDIYCQSMATYGYDRVAYSLITDHPHLGLTRQNGFVTSYPDHWMDYYRQHDYIDVDPVIKRALHSTCPFFWSDLKEMSEAEQQLMDEAEESHVSDGACIPLYNTTGEIAGVGLARSDKHQPHTQNYNHLGQQQLITMFFHETFRQFYEKNITPHLSPRQQAVLSWAAEGCTNADIGNKLNITENTVKDHFKHINGQLKTNGRAQAIAKAIIYKLIIPNTIKK